MKTITVKISDQDVEVPCSFGKYDIVRVIGSGSFSTVALVTHRITNMQFACKICSRKLLTESNTFDRFEQEVRLMQSLHHPNIVSVIDVAYDQNLIYLIMEYCANGELFEYICNHGRLDSELCQRVFSKLVSALVYLHSRDIAHRDLKPENILLDETYDPKIADFGLCHVTTENQLLSTPCGSPYYAPPEIIANEEYDGKAGDVWSLGVVLYTMATGGLPWQDTNQMRLFEKIKQAEFIIPGYVQPQVSGLLQQMMNPVPSYRPTMLMLQRDPWVDEACDARAFLDLPLKQQRSAPWISMSGTTSFALKSGVVSSSLDHSRIHRKQIIVRPVSSANLKTRPTVQPIETLIRRVPTSGKRRMSNALP